MNGKEIRLLKDILIFSIGNIGSKIILFLLVPLHTNYLTTEEYGIADLVFTVSQFVIPFLFIVIFDAVTRFGLSKENRPEDVLLCSFAVIFIGTCAAALLTPFMGLYAVLDRWKWYVFAYVVITASNSVIMNYLKVTEKNKMYAAISIVQTLILAGLNVLLLVFVKAGISGYLLANTVSVALGTVLAFFMGRMGKDLLRAKFDKKLLKEMIVFSSPLIMNNVSWWVIHSSDKIMIEYMIGATALGIYTVATKIPSMVNVFISIFSQAWGISSVKEIESTNDRSFYLSVFNSYSTVAFGAVICINAIVKPFVTLYVGSEFESAWKFVPFLLVSAVFSAISSFYGSMYGALKKSRNNMLTTLAAATVNIVMNFIFINIWGVWGAIAGTVAAYVMIAFLRHADLNRFLKLAINKKTVLINCFLIFFQATTVTMEIFPYAVSTISLGIFLVNNKKVLFEMAETGKAIIVKMKKR